jgi:hypothetical protein
MTDTETPLVLNTDGPDTPEYAKQVARHLAEAVRVLNHLTLGHRVPRTLQQPADADYVLVEVVTAIERLPQFLGQLAAWYSNALAAGGLEVKYGQFERNTSGAVLTLKQDLVAADNGLGRVYEALDRARQISGAIGAPCDPSEDPDA